MNFRKFLAILTVVIVIAPAVQASAATKITPGSKCSKAGVTQNYNGKKYTCIKLGSKLYWNNGVKIPSNTKSLSNLPATCTVFNSTWLTVSEQGYANIDGKILLTTSVINSSISNVATDVKVFIEWHDSIGLSFKKTIEIPRLYPAQSIDFGDTEGFALNSIDYPGIPNKINVRSTCKSVPLNTKDLVNGKFPILTGVVPADVKVTTFEDEISKRVGSSFVVKNIFKKNMTITEQVDIGSKNKTHLYGVFKDKLGNILAGFNEYLRGDYRIIEPGESARVDMNFLDFSNTDNQIIDKISTFEYTIIID